MTWTFILASVRNVVDESVAVRSGAECDRMTPADMRGITIDLNDRGLVRIELTPGEVGAEQQQNVAAEYRSMSGGGADNPGHSDVVRVVVLDEVLAPGCMGHRRLQARGGGDYLVVRAGATGAGVETVRAKFRGQRGPTQLSRRMQCWTAAMEGWPTLPRQEADTEIMGDGTAFTLI
jgi:hypothetical protein